MKTISLPQTLLRAMLLSLSLGLTSPAAFAGSDATHARHGADAAASAEEFSFGKPGDPKMISRTIQVDMDDNMRFTPDDIKVRQGETIRFAVRNRGKLLHEMVIGTMAQLRSHQGKMRKHPGMEHDDANMTHVRPGKQGAMLWQFTKAGEFYFACLIPGHFEAGMAGKITATKG